jgi:predicted NUDIX family NTP pyrophosphohydrolase
MPQTSAGVLLFRERKGEIEVFLVHLGGPFWAARDDGAWSIPKGEVEPGEEPLAAARREFAEETGCAAAGELLPLTPVRQKGGKLVHAWALEGDCDPGDLKSNRFALEWPPRSGKHQEFPEVDRAEWFHIPAALRKILPGQQPLLLELARRRGEGRSLS